MLPVRSVNRMLMAPPIRVMPPEVMALDIETDCATDAAGARGRADGGCNERRPVEPSIVDLHRGDGRCRGRGTLNPIFRGNASR